MPDSLRARRPDRRCKVCNHTFLWHSKKMSFGGHETEAGYCRCESFVEKVK